METAATHFVDISLLQTWYKRDDNASPPVYCLQPITTHFEHYHSSDSLLRQRDRDGWWATFSSLQRLTWRLAEQAVDSMRMSAEVAHTFLMSGIHACTYMYMGSKLYRHVLFIGLEVM